MTLNLEHNNDEVKDLFPLNATKRDTVRLNMVLLAQNLKMPCILACTIYTESYSITVSTLRSIFATIDRAD